MFTHTLSGNNQENQKTTIEKKMITLKQQATVSFHHLNVQEVVVMLSLMDNLAREYKYTISRKDASESSYQEYRRKGLQLLTLHKLGLCTSDPAMLQWDVEDFPEARELAEKYAERSHHAE